MVTMIDVIEHIVTEEKLRGAFENVKQCLADDGVFVLGPLMNRTKRHLFYVHFWTPEDVKRLFGGYHFSEPLWFRNGNLVLISRNATKVAPAKDSE